MEDLNLSGAQAKNMKLVLDSPTVVCPKCGGKIFVESFILKKVSPILTGAPTEQLFPIPVYTCIKCGEIPDEYRSKGNFDAIMGENKETGEEKKPASGIII